MWTGLPLTKGVVAYFKLYILLKYQCLQDIFIWIHQCIVTVGLSKGCVRQPATYDGVFSHRREKVRTDIWLLHITLFYVSRAWLVKKFGVTQGHFSIFLTLISLPPFLWLKLECIEWYRTHRVVDRWSPAGGSGDCQVQLRPTYTLLAAAAASQTLRPWGLNNKTHSIHQGHQT